MRVLAAVLLLALAVPVARAQDEKNDPLYIAVVGPMTGSAAAFGEPIRMAAGLAVAQINAKGGIGGRLLKLVVEDDRGIGRDAATVARKLAGDKRILAVVGHFNSSCSLAAKPTYLAAKLPTVSPGSTNVALCTGSDYAFRIVYKDDDQGRMLARYAQQIGLSKVAIVGEGDEYGKGLATHFAAEAKTIGLEVVATETYHRGRTQDFRPHMTRVKAAGATGVFIAGLYNEAGLIVKAAADLKMTGVRFLGGDGLASPDLVRICGAAAEGVLSTMPFEFDPRADAGSPEATFRAAYKARHRKDPDAWAALTYDATRMVIEAIRQGATSRTAIRAWLAGRKSRKTAYTGVTGRMWFDGNGDSIKEPPLAITRITKGKFVRARRQLGEGK